MAIYNQSCEVSQYAREMRARWLMHCFFKGKLKLPPPSPEERIEQMKSFAYGNCKLHNEDITRELVDEVFEKMRCGHGKI